MIHTCMYSFNRLFSGISACLGTILCLLSCTVIHKFCGVMILLTRKENHSLQLPVWRRSGNGWQTALHL